MNRAEIDPQIDSNVINAYIANMATLLIRKLPDTVREKLRVRAAMAGRSMEAEAREVLARAVDQPQAGLDAAHSTGHADLRSTGQAAVRLTGTDTSGGSDNLERWYRFQAAVMAGLPIERVGSEASGELIRDRRRETIIQMIIEGDDPRDVLGAEFAERIAEAGLSEPDISVLKRRFADDRS